MMTITLDEAVFTAIIEDAVVKALSRIESSKEREVNMERPITTKELCEYLGVTEPTVLRWRNKGKIPFFTIGSAVRFNLAEVLKALGE